MQAVADTMLHSLIWLCLERLNYENPTSHSRRDKRNRNFRRGSIKARLFGRGNLPNAEIPSIAKEKERFACEIRKIMREPGTHGSILKDYER